MRCVACMRLSSTPKPPAFVTAGIPVLSMSRGMPGSISSTMDARSAPSLLQTISPVAPPVILDDAQSAPPPPGAAPRQPPPAPEPGREAAAPSSPAPVPAPATPAPATARPATRPGETGQWVYTQQYGWLWMAHGDAYWYAPPTGRGQPYAYVLRPDHGWTWVEAPWVWGLGPWPHFGASGPTRFGWYRAGYWRTPWRWQYWPGRYRGRPARPGA